MSVRLELTPKQHRMVTRALCIALADSMSAIRSDSLTWPADEWKELLDTVVRAGELGRGAKEKPRRAGLPGA